MSEGEPDEICSQGALARLVAAASQGATAVAGLPSASPRRPTPRRWPSPRPSPTRPATRSTASSTPTSCSDGTYSPLAGTVTVADGVVSLPLEPGTYKLEFGDEDGPFVPEYYNDKATFGHGRPRRRRRCPTALAPVVPGARPPLTGHVVSPRAARSRAPLVSLYDAATNTPSRLRHDQRDRWRSPSASSRLLQAAAPPPAATPRSTTPTSPPSRPPTRSPFRRRRSAGQIAVSDGSVVTGRVTNAPGSAGARAASPTAPPAPAASTATSPTPTASSASRVSPGTYKVRFADPIGEYLAEWYNDKADAATADPVDVSRPDRHGRRLPGPRPGQRRPAATVDSQGTVIDSAGAPVIGATRRRVLHPRRPTAEAFAATHQPRRPVRLHRAGPHEPRTRSSSRPSDSYPARRASTPA